ncbi:MAG: type IV pilin N-terminal domain-containing protein, partial [Methanomicrobiales archaeon]
MDVRDRAVSEIVGTLLLVGIVVIGIVLAGLLLFSHPAASRVPVFDCIISNQSNTIYLYHKGGDSLSAGEYRILVDGVDRTANFTFMSPGTEPWSVG